MSPTSLRLRLLLIAAPVVHGCSSSPASPETPATTPTAAPTTAVVVPVASAGPAKSTEVPYIPLRPATSATAAATTPSSWKVGTAFCVSPSRTEGEPAGMGCGKDLKVDAIKEIRNSKDACGHCYYVFSEPATSQTMSDRQSSGCCYSERYPSRGRLLVVDSVERQSAIVSDLAGLERVSMSPSLGLRLRLLALVAPAVHGCSASPAAGPDTSAPPGTTTVTLPTATATATATAPATTAAATTAPTARPTAPPLASARTPPPARPEAWEQGTVVCVTAAHTESRTQASPGAPFANCGGWPEFSFVSDTLRSLPCGPCSFTFSASATTQERHDRPDACCYQTRSPPLGRPLVVDDGARVARLVTAAWG